MTYHPGNSAAWQDRLEWPTIGVAVLAYGGFACALLWGTSIGPIAAIVVLALSQALQSSLQHEILHGHPFGRRWANEALAFPAIGLFVPYGRFRDTHLAHHFDPNLTDPYDDPESNFADPAEWAARPRWKRVLSRANNTLLGRIVLGPAIGLAAFYAKDLRQIRQGQRPVLRAYLSHGMGVTLVIALWVALSSQALWVLFVSAYVAMGLIRIRTFLEHRAHTAARARTVIIEDRGPLAFLFLNNNLHAVHHVHPDVPWYRLRKVYHANRLGYLRRNDGYVYKSYAQIFRMYLLRQKDPVPHPLMPGPDDLAPAVRQREPVHALGPLQADERPFDAR